jgi:hypothetical protein
MNDLSQDIKNAIQELDPNAFGEISVSSQSKHFTVSGRLHSSIDKKDLSSLIQDLVKAEDSERQVLLNVETPRRGLRVKTQVGKVVTEAATRRKEKKPLDEMDIIFYGLVNTEILTPNDQYKKRNHETFLKVKNIVEVLGVIEPLIVDKNYKIIDGNLRLEVARKLGIDRIPVMVLDDDGIKSDFLRLVTNRSEEFQRWVYAEVDQFVDSIPQAQPLLEPLGFFGNKILPQTFFGNTVINYELDEFNDQQKKYSQDIGLATWAEMKRKEALRIEKKKQAARDKKKTNPKGKVSLFDLQPTEDDFLPTYDAQAEIQEHTEEMRKLAGTITDAFDAKRKAEMEEKGVEWQNTRMTSQQLADVKRAAAEAEAKLSKATKRIKQTENGSTAEPDVDAEVTPELDPSSDSDLVSD